MAETTKPKTRTDTDRLDWLERRGASVHRRPDGRYAVSRDARDYDWFRAATLREAIDKAMDGEG